MMCGGRWSPAGFNKTVVGPTIYLVKTSKCNSKRFRCGFATQHHVSGMEHPGHKLILRKKGDL